MNDDIMNLDFPLVLTPQDVCFDSGALVLSERGRQRLVAGDRWCSLPNMSMHLPRGRQRGEEERPHGFERELIRPVSMDTPSMIRRAWWSDPRDPHHEMAMTATNQLYTWVLRVWRPARPAVTVGLGSWVRGAWFALIRWVERPAKLEER